MALAGPLRLVAQITLALLWLSRAQAQDVTIPIRIGVLTDISGHLANVSGLGTVEAVKMAAADMGDSLLGRRIEVVYADHQDKADVGLAIARKWFDVDHVRLILDVNNSALALGLQTLTREKDQIVVFGGAMSSDLTGKACSPNGFAWLTDTYAQAHAMVAQYVPKGSKTWFTITPDYAFGLAAERDVQNALATAGGQFLGSVRAPSPLDEPSSYVLQAQVSGASIIEMIQGGTDLQNIIKAAHEFGVGQTDAQKLAALVLFPTEVRGVGLEAAQGIRTANAFYWDQNEAARAWSQRYFARTGHMPEPVQAGMYSAATHYLKAIKAAGTDDTQAILAQMRATPVNDFMTNGASIRKDGRLARDLYVFEVKKPAESNSAWDVFKPLATVPAAQILRPLTEGGCPLAN